MPIESRLLLPLHYEQMVVRERKSLTQRGKMKPALVTPVAILTVLVIALAVASTVPMVTVTYREPYTATEILHGRSGTH